MTTQKSAEAQDVQFTFAANETAVELSAAESSLMMLGLTGISTVTFFTGDASVAVNQVRARLRETVEANPWLAGRLVKGGKSGMPLRLVYSTSASALDVAVSKILRVDPPGLKLDDTLSYDKLCKVVAKSDAQVGPGHKIMDKDLPIARVTIVSGPTDQSSFALVFSLAHTVADGHTYYRILNQLGGQAASPLGVPRKPLALASVIGEKEHKWLFGAPHFAVAIAGMISGKKTKAHAFLVDQARVAEGKAAAKAAGAAFVSTNDLLTSSFASLVDARLCMMAINLRGRVEGLDPSDAGNYEGMLLLDRETYGSPAAVRATLQSGPPFGGTCSTPLPGVCGGIFSQIAQITNWSTFSKDLLFDGCDERLHLPIVDLGMIPYECSIIFRPSPGKLGVLYLTKKYQRSHFAAGGAPLGDSVSTAMFGDERV